MKIFIAILIITCCSSSYGQNKISFEAYAIVHANTGATKKSDINYGQKIQSDYDSIKGGFTTLTTKNYNVHTTFEYKLKPGVSVGLKAFLLPEKKLNFSLGVEYSLFSIAVKPKSKSSMSTSSVNTFIPFSGGGPFSIGQLYGDSRIDELLPLWNNRWQTFYFSSINIPLSANYNYKQWRFSAGAAMQLLLSNSKKSEPATGDPESFIPTGYEEVNKAKTSFSALISISRKFFNKCRIGIEYSAGFKPLINEYAVKNDIFFSGEIKSISEIKSQRLGITVGWEIN